jgi:hypothetical protein
VLLTTVLTTIRRPLCAAAPAVLPALLPALLLAACATAPSGPPPPFSSYVVLGENGAAIARVLVDAPACPEIKLDDRSQPMTLRAPAATIALRGTPSAPADSRPAAFPLLTCEAVLPAATASASVYGRALPLPKAEPVRIVVIGDTGCRLQKAATATRPATTPPNTRLPPSPPRRRPGGPTW